MNLDQERTEYHAILGDALERMIAKHPPGELIQHDEEGDALQFAPLWHEMIEMGFAGIAMDEAHGGSNGTLNDALLVMEKLGIGAAPSPFFGHWLASATLANTAGNPDLEHWLPRLASGEVTATFGIASSVENNCVDSNIFCEWSAFGKSADLIVMMSPTGEIWLVETQDPTVSIVRQDCIDPTRQACKLTVPGRAPALIDQALTSRMIQAARILLAAECWGSAKQMFEKAKEHSLLRRQFGHVLADFQAVKHALAEISLTVEFARPYLWNAAHLWDSQDKKSGEVIALCKAHITENALTIGRRCIELHGASGFLLEGDLHLWFNRARYCSVYLGTPSQLRREVAAARHWDL